MSLEKKVSPLPPLGRPSIIESYPIEGDTYSWGKTGRILTESAFLAVLNASGEDLLAVDLCSSYPILREIMTGQHKERIHNEARRFTGMFVNDLNAPLGKNKLPFTANFNTDTLTALRKILTPKRSETRMLLISPIFDLMLNPPPPGNRTPEATSLILFEKFNNSNAYLNHVIEPEGKSGDKGTWTFIVRHEGENTLPSILSPILGDETINFLKNLSLYFGKLLANPNTLRGIKFVSLDLAPFGKIVEDAKKGFPPKMQGTLFFKSAQSPSAHIRANILYLPFPEGKVGFFSSIEGWPYYGTFLDPKGNIAVAKQISLQLAPGGKAVFFPWIMQKDDLQMHLTLDVIEDMWTENGLKVEKLNFTKDEILAMMSDRELVLSGHSPILQKGENFTSLTLSKPKS